MARLTAKDWADAALTAIRGGGGLAAVAVEPLAARLGATKGSFYWHFASRDALVEAALARWEEQETEAVIALVAEETDPRDRIRKLFDVAVTAAVNGPDNAPDNGPDLVEQALLADAAHPLVAATLHRVTERRLSYLTDLFTELGQPPEQARHRALLAYTVYLGHAQLTHAVPEALPQAQQNHPYLETVLTSLLGD